MYSITAVYYTIKVENGITIKTWKVDYFSGEDFTQAYSAMQFALKDTVHMLHYIFEGKCKVLLEMEEEAFSR